MAIIEHHEVSGLTCDATGCTARFDHVRESPFSSRVTEARAEAAALGWTFWTNRTVRVYCPAHGPKMPTQMRNVTRAWTTR